MNTETANTSESFSIGSYRVELYYQKMSPRQETLATVNLFEAPGIDYKGRTALLYFYFDSPIPTDGIDNARRNYYKRLHISSFRSVLSDLRRCTGLVCKTTPYGANANRIWIDLDFWSDDKVSAQTGSKKSEREAASEAHPRFTVQNCEWPENKPALFLSAAGGNDHAVVAFDEVPFSGTPFFREETREYNLFYPVFMKPHLRFFVEGVKTGNLQCVAKPQFINGDLSWLTGVNTINRVRLGE